MSHIEKIILRCSDPDAQRRFYKDVLGMKSLDGGSVGYGGRDASLVFQKSDGIYSPTSSDLYWKISLAVPDIELACAQLRAQNIDVATPQQFGDIAYLAHFKDREGFTVELLDHWFKDNRPSGLTKVNRDLFGGGAHLNLLTLRSSDIKPDMESCLNSGMKLLCVMPVESRGFSLYFFAYTDDVPPSSDPYSVENREWVFQREYTVLEIQHLHTGVEILRTKNKEAGYVGTIILDAFAVAELLMAPEI